MNIAYAANPQTFSDLINLVVFDLVNPLIVLAASIAFLAFFWGVAKYILSAGDEKSKEYGKNIMVYGVIALFVLVSVWGLIQILKNTFFENAPSPAESTQTSPSSPSSPYFPPPVDPDIPGAPTPF